MIREMRTSDWEAVKAIFEQSVEKGNATFWTFCPKFEDWDDSHAKVCRFVYETDGRVVGYIVISPHSSRECYKGVAEISVYIDEKYRGRGIGTVLLTKVKEEARKQGYWTLYSNIFTDNEASIKLHEKCGFRVVGIRDRIAKNKLGNWQSTTMMEWRNDYE